MKSVCVEKRVLRIRGSLNIPLTNQSCEKKNTTRVIDYENSSTFQTSSKKAKNKERNKLSKKKTKQTKNKTNRKCLE